VDSETELLIPVLSETAVSPPDVKPRSALATPLNMKAGSSSSSPTKIFIMPSPKPLPRPPVERGQSKAFSFKVTPSQLLRVRRGAEREAAERRKCCGAYYWREAVMGRIHSWLAALAAGLLALAAWVLSHVPLALAILTPVSFTLLVVMAQYSATAVAAAAFLPT
jgi:hypothetical protein